MQDDQRKTEDSGYRYDEDAEGHENQLEFDRDYATYDALQQKGLINPEMEEKIREDLEQDRPDPRSASSAEGKQADQSAEGYEDSDRDIEDEANKRLEVHAEVDATNIRVTVQKGEITLEGMVGSRATKRLAEDLLETVPGMRDIHNRLYIRGD